MADSLPDEITLMLRLDDGTPLPPELADFRTMLQLARAAAAVEAAEPAVSVDLTALRLQKASEMRDCLMAFDDAVVFLHERLLEHEALCRRLAAIRQRSTVQPARPNWALVYDEAFQIASDGSSGGEDVDDWLSEAKWQQRRRRISPNDGGGAAPSAEPPASDFDADEEEETVDQRVAASRQQIKGLLRALAASRAGSHNPDALPKQSTPATRRSKLDLRMATAAHRKRTPEEE